MGGEKDRGGRDLEGEVGKGAPIDGMSIHIETASWLLHLLL